MCGCFTSHEIAPSAILTSGKLPFPAISPALKLRIQPISELPNATKQTRFSQRTRKIMAALLSQDIKARGYVQRNHKTETNRLTARSRHHNTLKAQITQDHQISYHHPPSPPPSSSSSSPSTNSLNIHLLRKLPGHMQLTNRQRRLMPHDGREEVPRDVRALALMARQADRRGRQVGGILDLRFLLSRRGGGSSGSSRGSRGSLLG